MKLFTTAALVTALAVSTAVAAPTDSESVANEYKSVMDSAAPSLITVKFVLKFQGPNATRDFDREITATMIDKSGLVLCSGVQLGTSKLFRQMGTATPTDLKVLIGDDTVGIEAKLLATDAELDLAWVRVKDASKLPADLKYIDFSKEQSASLGDEVYSVNRMDKFFDRAPFVTAGRIAGETTKPREMQIPGAGLDLEPGMPVFNAAGEAVGVAVFQAPDPEDEGARGANATLILPTKQLNKATKRALAAATEEGEEEDEGLVPPPPAEKTTGDNAANDKDKTGDK